MTFWPIFKPNFVLNECKYICLHTYSVISVRWGFGDKYDFWKNFVSCDTKIVPAKDVLQHSWSHECHFRIFRMSRIFLSLENRHFWFWKKIAFVLFKTFWYQLVQWMVGTVDQWLQVLLPTFSRLWVRIVALTNFFWKGVTQAIKNGLFPLFRSFGSSFKHFSNYR